jgi:hypothetical protein
MKTYSIALAFLIISLSISGCNSGIGNPFAGGQFDVGSHHLSFSHAVADWQTANDRMVLKFDLLSGSSFPTASVTIENISTVQVNVEYDTTVDIAISQGNTYKSSPTTAGATAKIKFTQFDLSPTGAVTGIITGMAQSVENPSQAPVDLAADFADVLISN